MLDYDESLAKKQKWSCDSWPNYNFSMGPTKFKVQCTLKGCTWISRGLELKDVTEKLLANHIEEHLQNDPGCLDKFLPPVQRQTMAALPKNYNQAEKVQAMAFLPEKNYCTKKEQEKKNKEF